jgi:hypothetical protein
VRQIGAAIRGGKDGKTDDFRLKRIPSFSLTMASSCYPQSGRRAGPGFTNGWGAKCIFPAPPCEPWALPRNAPGATFRPRAGNKTESGELTDMLGRAVGDLARIRDLGLLVANSVVATAPRIVVGLLLN